jgi:hypothetical protein
LDAVAANVYGVPLVNPVTLQLIAGTLTVQLLPPGEAVTV